MTAIRRGAAALTINAEITERTEKCAVISACSALDVVDV
jgi:hypothetical protein